MQNLNMKKTEKIWTPVASFIYVPHNEQEYDQIVNLLDDLIDEVGEDESLSLIHI